MSKIGRYLKDAFWFGSTAAGTAYLNDRNARQREAEKNGAPQMAEPKKTDERVKVLKIIAGLIICVFCARCITAIYDDSASNGCWVNYGSDAVHCPSKIHYKEQSK